ncbi:hypothetical protein BSL78_09122 [Apostichopus japonicus]|uniref:Uncharacterized protein n=1 Tax=Stichopus japonicus TaxID=307972 RepID=A0A2G8L1A0_STIJA|nr:hypothetical protein BSL78_09122 [Apostichopus japonicus]
MGPVKNNSPDDSRIEMCLTEADCYSGNGREYRGYVSTTEDGMMCANWMVAKEHAVGVTETQYRTEQYIYDFHFFVTGIGDHNYCRNPDDDIKPWCYYGNSEDVVASWSYCDIPLCSDESVTTEPTSQAAPTSTPITSTLLSEGKEVSQSTTLNKFGFAGEASLAVDGNLEPRYRQRSCSSTERELDGWWAVDLGGIHNVEYVEVVNEFDNPLRIRRTEVSVGMVLTDLSTFEVCGVIKKNEAQKSILDPTRTIRVDCPQDLHGRYVRLQMKRRDFLTLCEIRVWGTEASVPCGPRQFMCHSQDECISDTFLCDREEDCSDGSDEESCVYPEKLFSEFEDRALPNVAPLAMYRNRLVEDCAKICLYDLNFTCRSFEYNVVQQSCRFYDQTRADTGGLSIMTGYNHYELKSQSQNCPTNDENYHPCPGGTCIDSSKLCDSRNDCGDFSDERNCGSHDEYSIQLSNGTAPNEGRVEVNYQGQWGLVCDDFWEINDANVVCRELGYIRGASKALTVAAFGHGNRGIFFMDDVRCSGTESSLKDCNFSGWGIHNCVVGEAAGVQCYLDEDQIHHYYGGIKVTEQVILKSCE